MFVAWLNEHFKDAESARTTICWIAGVGAAMSAAAFAIGMLLAK